MRSFTKPFLVAFAFVLIGVGFVMWPLPIPLGIPMIATGCVILLRYTWTGRRFFVRLKRRFPQTLGPVRDRLRRNRLKQRAMAKAGAEGLPPGEVM
jgi:hypothetical protein